MSSVENGALGIFEAGTAKAKGFVNPAVGKIGE